jgi:L-ascorbate metabolism protein UlaG (beta-lactamase superfamily)
LVLRYIGHATVLVELDGVRFLTDPLLRMRVAHLRRAAPIQPIDEIDAVLISHGHYDHLDLPSLRALAAKVVVPRGLGARLRGFEVVEVDEGDEVSVGSVACRARWRPASMGPEQRSRLRPDRLETDLLRRRHRPLPRDGRARSGA